MIQWASGPQIPAFLLRSQVHTLTPAAEDLPPHGLQLMHAHYWEMMGQMTASSLIKTVYCLEASGAVDWHPCIRVHGYKASLPQVGLQGVCFIFAITHLLL